MRFFMYTLGDERRPFPPPTPEDMARMGAFMAEATRAGVLLATGAFGSSTEAVKVQYAGGTCTVTDGPFTEAKELIGGWALVRASSIEEATGWAKRFLGVVGADGAESRIRQVFGPEDLSGITG
jgi:hypothetical protein